MVLSSPNRLTAHNLDEHPSLSLCEERCKSLEKRWSLGLQLHHENSGNLKLPAAWRRSTKHAEQPKKSMESTTAQVIHFASHHRTLQSSCAKHYPSHALRPRMVLSRVVGTVSIDSVNLHISITILYFNLLLQPFNFLQRLPSRNFILKPCMCGDPCIMTSGVQGWLQGWQLLK